MQAFRATLACLFALVAGAAFARASEPLQQPQLRIEAGMHTADLRRIDVSADGRLLVTGSDDRTARLWSLPDGRLLHTFRVPIGAGHAGEIYAVAISPDGRLLAAGGWDPALAANGDGTNHIYLFDTVSGELMKRLGPLPNVVYHLAFSPDGKRLAAGLGGTYGLRVWTAPFDSAPAYDFDYAGDIYGLAFDRSGRLATTSYEGSVRLYDQNLTLLQRKDVTTLPFGIAFSPDGTKLAIGYDGDLRVDIRDAATLDLAYSPDLSHAGGRSLSTVGWSADGQTLYAAGRNFSTDFHPILSWNAAGRGAMTLLPGPADTITDFATLPQGGVAFSSAQPAFGLLGSDGKPIPFKDGENAEQPYHDAVSADMRDKHDRQFGTTPDGTGVWFGLKDGTQDPWRFDISKLAFDASPQPPPDYIAAQTTTLPITGWHDSREPKLSGKPLVMAKDDTAESLGIAPDGQSFILGAFFWIYRFDAQGNPLWPRNIGVPSGAWGVNLTTDGRIFIAALGDGTIRWYRASDGQELLAFFVHVPDKRWIAWTPSGYYAASPGAEDLIGWHVNGRTWSNSPDFFPASRFRDQYYRPDIVQLVVSLGDEEQAIREASLRTKRKVEDESIRAQLPAVVEIVTKDREIKTANPELALSYRLRSPSGRPITKVEVKIDGRPVEARAAQTFDEYLSSDADHELDLGIPPRDVEISLIAYIGDQPSVAATIPVKWTGATSTGPKPKLFALMIGVSNYDNKDLKLNYAAKDADDLAKAFEAQEGRYFSKVYETELLDAKADKIAVETALAKLKRNAGPDDVVIVFMAGHGVTDAALDFYYLPANADLDPDLLDATAINGIDIRNALAKIPSKVVLFMDACRSGRGIEGGAGLVDMTKLANDFAQDTTGLVMFASSTGRQDSLESSDWGNGAFTRALLSILNDPQAYGKDGKLSISELDEELSERVSELTDGRQNAVMTKYGAIPRFFLAALQ